MDASLGLGPSHVSSGGQGCVLTFFRLLNHIASGDVEFGEFPREREGRGA
jgi:hypothetical protein